MKTCRSNQNVRNVRWHFSDRTRSKPYATRLRVLMYGMYGVFIHTIYMEYIFQKCVEMTRDRARKIKIRPYIPYIPYI